MNCANQLVKWVERYGVNDLRTDRKLFHVRRDSKVYNIYYGDVVVVSVDKNIFRHNMSEAKKKIEPYLEIFLTFES